MHLLHTVILMTQHRFLSRRGYNIGIRLIDEFLAKSKTTKCVDFRDTADKVARVGVGTPLCMDRQLPKQHNRHSCKSCLLQVGFRMFLNASAVITSWNADNTACNLVSAKTA